MSIRINKSMGYGILFDSSEQLEEVLNHEVYGSPLMHVKGEPAKRYQEWLSKLQIDDIVNINLDMLTLNTHDYDGKTQKVSPKEVGSSESWDAFMDLRFSNFISFFEDEDEERVGIIVRPFLQAKEWYRHDDSIDYYTQNEMENSWKYLRREFYPYSSGVVRNRVTGEKSKLSLQLLNGLSEEHLDKLDPDWKNLYAAPPEEVHNMLEAFQLFKEIPLLTPVVATWWV